MSSKTIPSEMPPDVVSDGDRPPRGRSRQTSRMMATRLFSSANDVSSSAAPKAYGELRYEPPRAPNPKHESQHQAQTVQTKPLGRSSDIAPRRTRELGLGWTDLNGLIFCGTKRRFRLAVGAICVYNLHAATPKRV